MMNFDITQNITIFSGLFLGFATSFHCVGMCGPIVISLPLPGQSRWQQALGGVLYNLGRAVTYGLMGVAFGLLGQGLSTLGFQKMVSIIAGTLMIATAFFPSLFKFSDSLDHGLYRTVGSVKRALKHLLNIRSYSGLFLIGVLNGLLPCGPLYFAVMVSAGTGNVIESSLFMVMFGIGTMPLLLAVAMLGNVISVKLRNRINNFIPVIMVVMGILFILRGLSLGIPYLSPPDDKLNRVMKDGQKTVEKYEQLHDTTQKTSSDTAKSKHMGEHEGGH